MKSPVGAAIAVAFAAGTAGSAAIAAEASDLYGQCFVRIYDAGHLAAHPGQRVVAMRAQFQGFADDLLVSVTYSLRHGGDFGFSADCHEPIDGGFFCRACTNDSCDTGGENFRILWKGGDEVILANDRTGVMGENAEGGRDYLQARGEHAMFLLKRGAADRCGP